MAYLFTLLCHIFVNIIFDYLYFSAVILMLIVIYLPSLYLFYFIFINIFVNDSSLISIK